MEVISCTETAKLVRVALKRTFPKTKFSVRSDQYAGGASIDVSWVDGPAARLVEEVTASYAGGGFDGMIDMAYSKYSWLSPDGSATFAKVRGTIGSAGTVESEQHLQPSFKARLVRFGADYVFTNRRYSEGFYRRAAEAACRRHGLDIALVSVKTTSFGATLATDHLVEGSEYLSQLVYRELVRRTVMGA